MQNILIVDDVQTDRDLAGKVVQAAGHNPVYATTGQEGIDKAKQIRPALIFLDVVMPVLDGFATCRQLKGNPETSQIPVVLVTSKGAESDRFWGKRQGADDHVAKPFSPDAMAAIIRRFVR
jgi:twitching motility two-component system response regulator PilH